MVAGAGVQEGFVRLLYHSIQVMNSPSGYYRGIWYGRRNPGAKVGYIC